MYKKYSFRPLLTTFKEIAIPNLSQVILFLSLASVILSIVFSDRILGFFIEDNETKQYLKENLTSYLSNIDSLPFSEYLSSLLIWGVVGAFCYVVIVTLADLLIMTVNQYLLEKQNHSFVRFDSFSRFDEYRRVVWVFLTVIVLLISVSRLFVIWLDWFEIGFEDLSIFYILGSIFFLAYNLYLLYMLIWAARRNPHMYVAK